MSRCIKMSCTLPDLSEKLFEKIQLKARASNIEGFLMAQSPDLIKIVACGASADLDVFLDAIDELIIATGGAPIEIDPFLKDKDYRGVFRIML